MIDGRKWAGWRYIPMVKGKKDFRQNPVYTFTTNLNTEPELKEEIDRIMESVHLEE